MLSKDEYWTIEIIRRVAQETVVRRAISPQDFAELVARALRSWIDTLCSRAYDKGFEEGKLYSDRMRS